MSEQEAAAAEKEEKVVMALNGFESISTHAQHANASSRYVHNHSHNHNHAHAASGSATTEDVDELDQDQDQDETEADHDVDMEEDEVDQLDSDLDEPEDGEPVPAANGAAKSKGKKVSERTPGQSLLPISKVENILDADGTCLLFLYIFNLVYTERVSGRSHLISD